MLYIVGTELSTKQRPFDPRFPKQPRKAITWLPADIDWILGRISKTPGSDTVDYMFYCADNPQRTHTTTFKSCEEADTAISNARGDKIVNTDDSDRKEVNMEDKFNQVNNQLNRREGPNPKRGGRPGNLGRRFGR